MSSPGVPVGRRVVLGMLGVGVAGVVFGGRVQRGLERLLAPLTSRRGTGLSSLLPVGRFRIYSVTGALPERSEADYRLRVGGFVEQPFELTLAELKAMAPTRLTRDFQCVTGWRVESVKWTGVRVADLLDRAGVRPAAEGVRFYSFDGLYTESLTLPQARRDDVIIAYELEGRPVSRAQGGPARLYVAPMYGYKSAKWVGRIEITEGPAPPGYWAIRG